jgi:choline-phosphate cytidylyltransferase
MSSQHLSITFIIVRIEAVRHCRWVDEVLPEAPWIITEQFIEKYQIDYVAHDEEPYLSAGHDDVYALCKHLGMLVFNLDDRTWA